MNKYRKHQIDETPVEVSSLLRQHKNTQKPAAEMTAAGSRGSCGTVINI